MGYAAPDWLGNPDDVYVDSTEAQAYVDWSIEPHFGKWGVTDWGVSIDAVRVDYRTSFVKHNEEQEYPVDGVITYPTPTITADPVSDQKNFAGQVHQKAFTVELSFDSGNTLSLMPYAIEIQFDSSIIIVKF